jgi:hypothetical protein
VTDPAKKTPFREFVIMMADDLQISQNNNSAVNYKTDPTFYRYGNPDPVSGGRLDPQFSVSADNNCALSDALTIPGSGNRDPATPIFGAKVGDPARFRLIHPEGAGAAQVFTLNGHIWQREPYINDSTQIGNNKESQWMGSHDGEGSTDHFDLVVEAAGGKAGVPGDYLYSLFVPWRTNMGPAFGLWGVFRVAGVENGQLKVQPMPPQSAIDKCKVDGSGQPKLAPKVTDDPVVRFTRQAPKQAKP